MTLPPGTRVGAYEITGALGAGGMGEVYRARDTRLKREVALKVLPSAVADDPERLARFAREAEVLAALNHPNIAVIYGIEDAVLGPADAARDVRGTGAASGPAEAGHYGRQAAAASGAAEAGHDVYQVRALVMELVEGETLDERVARGAIPAHEALTIAKQIADALEAAHERGVIHRDIKPANIRVRHDGTVKVLDFGLARLAEPEAAGALSGATPIPASLSPTITSPALVTHAGVLLGTAAYMSPEQAKGQRADHRSDVFALGAVLYEMLTGRRAFAGESVPETLAHVIAREPDFGALPERLTPRLVELLKRCLEKTPKRRWQAMGDLRAEIEIVSASPFASPAAAHASDLRRHPWLLLTAAALTGAALASVGWSWRAADPSSSASEPRQFSEPIGHTTDTLRGALAISPQGTHLAYVAEEGLYIRRVRDPEARLVPGSAGAGAPDFSPDGQSVAFLDSRDNGIKRYDLDGQRPFSICTTCGRITSIHWYEEGWIAYSSRDAIMRLPARGGAPELMVSVGPASQAFGPYVLPGGRAMIFTVAPAGGTFDDDPLIVLQPLPSGERIDLARGTDGRFFPLTGHLLYASGAALMAAPFDPETSALGPAKPVVPGVLRSQDGATGAAHYDVSQHGMLVYLPDPGATQLFLIRPDAEPEPLDLDPGAYDLPRLSPDGRQLAFVTRTARGPEVWIYDMTGAEAPRELAPGDYPVWSGDGAHLVFQTSDGKTARIVRRRADGTGRAEELTAPDAGVIHVPEGWRPGTQEFSFSEVRDREVSLWIYSMVDRKTRRFDEELVATGLFNSAFSHDGRWIAYTHRSSPQPTRVFVQPVPRTGDAVGLPANQPHHPLWTPGQHQLLYFPAGGRLSRVNLRNGRAFSPAAIVSGGFPSNTSGISGRRHDIGPNGELVAALGPSFAIDRGLVHAKVMLNFGEWLRREVR